MEFRKAVMTYATYSELFGRKYDEERLKEFISKLPLGGIFRVLSQMCVLESNDRHCVEMFFSKIHMINEEDASKIKSKVKNHYLYSTQGLLAVWKWLLAYGNKQSLHDDLDEGVSITTIIYLCLIISDYLYDEDKDLIHDVVKNAMFNATEDLGSMIGRSAYIYFDLAQNRELYEENEYLDFVRDFYEAKGYTLSQHFAVLFAIRAMFMKYSLDLDANWRKDINEIFRNTTAARIANSIIEPYTVDFDQANAWALDKINSPWDYTLFQRGMFFRFPDGKVLPIHKKLLEELFYNGIFHGIRHCYTETDRRFLTFFGRPFEHYLAKIMQLSVDSSHIPYKFIEEFRFGRDRSKRSPDVMLILGDKLLAIEAKARRVRLDTVIGEDPNSVYEDMQKLVINPLNQLKKCLTQLSASPEGEFLKNINEIYLITVTQSGFPTLPPLETKIAEAVKKDDTNLPIKEINHFSVEEYEMLCSLVAKRNGKPIFRTLEIKNRVAPEIPFKNFLLHYSYHPRRATELQERGVAMIMDARDQLFAE